MILVFDGKCVLCSRGVAFVLRRDHARKFRFAATQSRAGRRLMERYGLDPDSPETMILIDGERCYFQSAAMIRVSRNLGWPSKAAVALWLVPAPLRDALYRWLARNRLRLFGRRESCYVPAKEDRDRFLE